MMDAGGCRGQDYGKRGNRCGKKNWVYVEMEGKTERGERRGAITGGRAAEKILKKGEVKYGNRRKKIKEACRWGRRGCRLGRKVK